MYLQVCRRRTFHTFDPFGLHHATLYYPHPYVQKMMTSSIHPHTAHMLA
jgi:hypothetical protein